MSQSSKITVDLDQETIELLVKHHVDTMNNESIMVFMESLLDKKPIQEALYDAVLNESIIKALETMIADLNLE